MVVLCFCHGQMHVVVIAAATAALHNAKTSKGFATRAIPYTGAKMRQKCIFQISMLGHLFTFDIIFQSIN